MQSRPSPTIGADVVPLTRPPVRRLLMATDAGFSHIGAKT
jgi:hypothetical protein